MHALNDENYNPKRLKLYIQENLILNDYVKQPTNEINKQTIMHDKLQTSAQLLEFARKNN